ncbi:MAG: MerR family transcriptional regulator [Dysgonamonadaceae bacterium]|jgi:DNA-binding transcriptional MerR regulator|nr:MerR family transcriptional regulator [Dysgonamonadaceae bacterium]
MKPLEQKKILYSIAEVAEMFGINQSALRYWEKEFDTVKPQKSEKGTRYYREKDIEEIRLIYNLIKEKGMTILGAKKKLKENRESLVKTSEIVSRLKAVRDELLGLQTQFDTLAQAAM